ncbi:MAG TPA: radical SAM family heme chaperone HemW [Burkholderiaceae bacterium]|nr:radical SAM family heme chaperone HemW [Burkholderiaceae bacterium]
MAIVPAGSLSRGRTALSQLPPLSLYVHLPWCIRKCPYCDFNSHEAGEAIPEARYLDALRADLEASLPQVWGRAVQTVFIGGGTPSLFSPEGIDQLLRDVRALLKLAPDAEVTLEANPGTFEQGRFRAFREAGVTRLSLGVQSFDERALRALGRVHDRAQALAAAALAAERYPTFNLDLMYALPGQDLAGLEADLAQALAFEPPHLSYYHLTLEPNTLFAAKPPEGLPDDDLSADMQQAIEARTAGAGLARYEVSAYARPGHRSRHNLNYWTFGDYLAIGAGAHGKLSFHDRIERSARLRHPRAYMDAALAGDAVEQRRTLSADDLPFEFMLNALRLVEGVSAASFAERTGVSLAAIAPALARAAERGLLDPDPSTIRATPLGLAFLNDLQQMFLT